MSIDDTAYRSSAGVNWSLLKLLDEQAGGCPADLRDAIDHPTDTDTHSRRGLRLVHTLALEPQHFARDYYIPRAHPSTVESVEKRLRGESEHDVLSAIVAALLGEDGPTIVTFDGDRRGKAWTECKAANEGRVIARPGEIVSSEPIADDIVHDILAARAGRTRVTQRQYDEAAAAAEAVRSHPIAGPIVTNPRNQYEQVVRYTDPDTGLPCKGRQDIYALDDRMVWDLKSMRSAHPRDVEREIGRMRYHGQGAHYTRSNGFGFGIIAVAKCSNSATYRVTVMRLGDAWMQLGRALRDRLAARYAECVASGVWPDHHADGQIIEADSPPNYAIDAALAFEDDFTSSTED